MDKIKAFFTKKKLDAKFKKLGEGHKLTNEQKRAAFHTNAPPQHPVPQFFEPPKTSYATADAEQAAQAALKRLQLSQRDQPKTVTRSSQAVKAEAKRQLEVEHKPDGGPASTYQKLPRVVELDAAPALAVSGIFFTCELLSDDICLPKKEMQVEVENFLRQSLIDDDPVVASSIMIHSLNGADMQKIETGVEILGKYLKNIIGAPEEDKYRRIKGSNKIFQEKVANLKGAVEFLKAVEFQHVKEGDESFFVLPRQPSDPHADALDVERLGLAYECLVNGQAVPLKLHRNPQVFPPNSRPLADLSLPADFFHRTPEELRLAQLEKTEKLEQMLTLRTREMRERDELRSIYKYKYCVVRVRFPDGFMLQGTFKSAEKLSTVEQFLRTHIFLDWAPCVLKDPFGDIFSGGKMDKTLAELKLSPAATLHFEFDPTFLKEYLASGQILPVHYLKPQDIDQ